jgi:tetratricopeptide (TPR) repeat protein
MSNNHSREAGSFLLKLSGNIYMHLLLLLLGCVIVYSNTLNAPFVYDDIPAIVENHIIKDLDLFAHTDNARPYNNTFEYKVFMRRYVGYLSFALNYSVSGLDPRSYHIVNIAIHAINAMLMYLFVLLLLRTPRLREHTALMHASYVAFLAAGLFAMHPIQTQAITYIWQRVTSLTALLYVLSAVAYLSWRLFDTEGRKHASAKRWGLYALAVVAAILAMRTKEIAFTLPVNLAIMEFFFFDGPIKKRAAALLPFFACMLLVPYYVIVSTMGDDGNLGASVLGATKETASMSRWEYLITQFTVITHYLRLVFFPKGFTLMYDYQLFSTILSARVLLSLSVLLTLAGSALWAIRYSMSSSARGTLLIYSFGVLWFFIAISVESSIIPIRHTIFEHRVYLPSFGLFAALAILVAYGVARVPSLRGRQVIIAALLCIMIALGVATYSRNSVWRTEISLWEDNIKKTPKLMEVYNNLTNAYLKEKRYEDVVRVASKAIEVDPRTHGGYHNLGIAYTGLGKYDEAITNIKKAIELTPQDPDFYKSIAQAYMQKGDSMSALNSYLVAIRYDMTDAELYNNAAVQYANLADYLKAIKFFQMSLTLNPNQIYPYVNMGKVYEVQGKVGFAIEQYLLAYQFDPGSAEINKLLAVAYRKSGDLDRANYYFKRFEGSAQ